jgi:hypothetical protein
VTSEATSFGTALIVETGFTLYKHISDCRHPPLERKINFQLTKVQGAMAVMTCCDQIVSDIGTRVTAKALMMNFQVCH